MSLVLWSACLSSVYDFCFPIPVSVVPTRIAIWLHSYRRPYSAVGSSAVIRLISDNSEMNYCWYPGHGRVIHM